MCLLSPSKNSAQNTKFKMSILCLNWPTPSAHALLQYSGIDFKCYFLKVCLIDLKFGESLSPHFSRSYVRFEVNQSYFYYYSLRFAYQKWGTCTLPHLVFHKTHVYHCWLLHPFWLCLNTCNPMSITQKVSHHSSMWVPRNRSFTNLYIKMGQGVQSLALRLSVGMTSPHTLFYWDALKQNFEVEHVDVILGHSVLYRQSISGMPTLMQKCWKWDQLGRAARQRGRTFGSFRG